MRASCRPGISAALALCLALGFPGQWLLNPSANAAPSDRFTVVGWVKNKLSPEEQVRSASRSERLRPMPAPSPQVAASSSHLQLAPAVHHPAAPPQRPPAPASRPASRNQHFTGERSVDELRRRAEFLAGKGLTYRFGGDHPSEGGMDCSGTMQFLLKSMGYPDIPRTSYNQYEWLRKKGTLRRVGLFHNAEKAQRNFRPGDLIFWGGTYNSGHKVSHVMIYLGRSRSGKHYIFGARGKKVRGLNGSGVDVFEFNPRSTGGRLIGYGPLPGLRS